MTYKTILAHLTTEMASRQILPSACALARRFQAHLIGAHTVEAIVPYPGIGLHIDDPRFKEFNDEMAAQNARIEALFEEHAGRAGVSREWRSTPARSPKASTQLLRSALRSDLIVVAKPNPEGERVDQVGAQNSLIAQSGRPVLMIPPGASDAKIGERALVAWNASREAVAAIQGALPLLSDAENTVVLTVANRWSDGDLETEGLELAAQLSRHGATVEVVHQEQTEASIGAQILASAATRGCDLVVMGAFGHSKLHSFIFGDATHHVMTEAEIPVLLSN